MLNGDLEKDCRFLTLILRHNPAALGIACKEGNWIEVKSLICKFEIYQRPISEEKLEKIVEEDKKHRYSFSQDHKYIKANKTVGDNMEYECKTPPMVLFYGTIEKNIDKIEKSGIVKEDDNFIHLYEDCYEAIKVVEKEVVVYQINSYRMHKTGYEFYVSKDKKWSTDWIPKNYIKMYYINNQFLSD